MTREELLYQLESLRNHCEIMKCDSDSVWRLDAEALEIAISELRSRHPNSPESLQKTGEWIEDDYSFYHCSNCGYEWDEREHVTPYCPNCGAKMDGGAD